MQFEIRGYEVDFPLPQSLEEANQRLDELTILQSQQAEEIRQLSHRDPVRKAKGRDMQETMIKIQVLKRWRKNANVIIQDRLNKSDLTDSSLLLTPEGLIHHLHLELQQLAREHQAFADHPNLSVVLNAAQHWLRNHYSKQIASAELVQDVFQEEQQHEEQKQYHLDRQRQQQQKRQFEQERQRHEGLKQWQAESTKAAAPKAVRSTADYPKLDEAVLQLLHQREQERLRQEQQEQAETAEALKLLSQLSKNPG